MSDDPVAVRVRVSGRVQGVNYRAWARREALALSLSGWIRNADDGSVQALVAGRRASVERFLAALRRGPGAARVDAVATEPADPPDKHGFLIHR